MIDEESERHSALRALVMKMIIDLAPWVAMNHSGDAVILPLVAEFKDMANGNAIEERVTLSAYHSLVVEFGLQDVHDHWAQRG